MRATQRLLSRGFFGRSADELKRLSQIALSRETVKGSAKPRLLYDFTTADSVQDCIVMCDTVIGGQSESHLDFVSERPPSSNTSPPDPDDSDRWASSVPTSYARFHGHISTHLPPSQPSIARTGFSAFRTPAPSPTLLGRTFYNIDPYQYLALRLRWSDGRSYLLNVQTESVEPTDLHQHRLFARRPGRWETVLVRWNDFVRTSHGFVVEPQGEMLRGKVKTFGIGLTDRVEGAFDVCVERVWATNDVGVDDTVVGESAESRDGEGEPGSEGGLRSKGGGKVKW